MSLDLKLQNCLSSTKSRYAGDHRKILFAIFWLTVLANQLKIHWQPLFNILKQSWRRTPFSWHHQITSLPFFIPTYSWYLIKNTDKLMSFSQKFLQLPPAFWRQWYTRTMHISNNSSSRGSTMNSVPADVYSSGISIAPQLFTQITVSVSCTTSHLSGWLRNEKPMLIKVDSSCQLHTLMTK